MLAGGSRRTGNRGVHSDRTRRPGALGRGTRVRVLVLVMALEWVGSVEATEDDSALHTFL